jgi:hypothetical protein
MRIGDITHYNVEEVELAPHQLTPTFSKGGQDLSTGFAPLRFLETVRAHGHSAKLLASPTGFTCRRAWDSTEVPIRLHRQVTGYIRDLD